MMIMMFYDVTGRQWRQRLSSKLGAGTKRPIEWGVAGLALFEIGTFLHKKVRPSLTNNTD